MDSVGEELERLARLKASGDLSDEEYELLKSRVIDSTADTSTEEPREAGENIKETPEIISSLKNTPSTEYDNLNTANNSSQESLKRTFLIFAILGGVAAYTTTPSPIDIFFGGLILGSLAYITHKTILKSKRGENLNFIKTPEEEPSIEKTEFEISFEVNESDLTDEEPEPNELVHRDFEVDPSLYKKIVSLILIVGLITLAIFTMRDDRNDYDAPASKVAGSTSTLSEINPTSVPEVTSTTIPGVTFKLSDEQISWVTEGRVSSLVNNSPILIDQETARCIFYNLIDSHGVNRTEKFYQDLFLSKTKTQEPHPSLLIESLTKCVPSLTYIAESAILNAGISLTCPHLSVINDVILSDWLKKGLSENKASTPAEIDSWLISKICAKGLGRYAPSNPVEFINGKLWSANKYSPLRSGPYWKADHESTWRRWCIELKDLLYETDMEEHLIDAWKSNCENTSSTLELIIETKQAELIKNSHSGDHDFSCLTKRYSAFLVSMTDLKELEILACHDYGEY